MANIDKDEDDYFKLIDIRNNQRSSTQLPSHLISSKFANKFLEHSKIRIYLLNTQQYYDITLGFSDTVRDVKNKVLTYMKSSNRFNLKYDVAEGRVF